MTLTDVTVDLNTESGAFLDNCLDAGSGCTATANVTIDGISSFSNNEGDGLTVASNGDVALSNVAANGNDGYGAELGCSCTSIGGNVTISDSTFNSNGWAVGDDGLDVAATGAITLTNVTADSNGLGGAYLISDSSVTIGGASNSFSNNMDDLGIGVEAFVAITLTNVTASSNGDVGAGLLTLGDVTINGSSNTFDGNGFDGVAIVSAGAVSLTNVTANDNDGYGVNVDSIFGLVSTSVALTNVFVDGNSDGGINIATVDGSVTLTDVTATNNLDTGIYIGGVSRDVMLTNVAADTNDEDGLDVDSVDSITITGGSFSDNSEDGIFLSTVDAVTIQGAKIVDNGGEGIDLESICSCVAAQVNFNRIVGNGTYGIQYDNSGVTVDATNNWWGCNYGPGATGAGCSGVTNGVFGDVDYDPWLILTMSPTTAVVIPTNGGTLPLIAYLTANSDGTDISSLGSIPDGTPATFSTTLGAVGSPSITKTTTDGVATATLTAGSTSGTASITIQVDAQTLGVNVLIGSTTESSVSVATAGGAPGGGSDLVITITPVVGIPVTSLPLPVVNTFEAALDVEATLNGTPLSELPGDMVIEISFELPAGFTGTPVIWFQLPDGTWQAVRTFVVGNRAVAFVHRMGVYALGVQ